MAELNQWSVSKLKCYQDCPYKFYCDYVAKLRTVENQKALTWGSCFHQCAEFFFNDFIFPSKERLLEYYKENWIAEQYVKDWKKILESNPQAERWKFLGYASEAEETQYFEMGKKILSEFWDRHFRMSYLPFAIELPLNERLPTGDLLVGFIDRVDKVKHSYRIMDYKTGKWESTPEDLKKDLQLGLYQWAFCKKYNIPYSSIEYCGLYYVRSFNLVPVNYLGIEIDAMLEQVTAIITKVKSNLFPKSPKQLWLCKNCLYKQNNICEGAQAAYDMEV